jgi:integrase
LDDFIKAGSFSPEPVPVDILAVDTLAGYDKKCLRRKTTVNGITRFTYRNGSIIERKTKGGGKTFAIHYQIEGKRVRHAVKGAQTRAEAITVLNIERTDAFREAHGLKRETPKLTFAEMADKYLEKSAKPNKKSWKSDETYLKTLKNEFGKLMLRDVTAEKIEDYKSRRLEVGLKGSSINRHLACLGVLFSTAIKWGYAVDNPVRQVKKFSEKGNVRERILSPDEEVRLTPVLPEYVRHIVSVAINTGMRRGEILSLKWADVDFDAEIIRIVKSKSGKPQTVPINSSLLSELRTLRATAGKNEHVFTNPETGKHYVDPKRAFKSALVAAGISGLTFHGLRHTCATRLIKFVDVATVRDVMRHANIATTGRYLHPQADEKRRAVERLCEKSPQPESPCQTGGKPESGEPVAVPVSETELAS